MRRASFVLASVAGALLLLGALGATASAQGPVKLGLLAPLSGFAASDGTSALNGVKMAIDEANSSGGVLGQKVQLVYYDDQADPKLAAQFATRLIESDHVTAIIGGSYSPPTLAAAPIAQQAQIPFVAAYAVAPDITATGNYIFRTGLGGINEGEAAAYVVAKRLNATRVAVLTLNNDFGLSLQEGFLDGAKKDGLQVVFQSKYPVGNENFIPLIARIRAANAQAVFVSAYYGEASNYLREAGQQGLNLPVVGSEGFDSPKLFQLAGSYADGVIVCTRLNRGSTRAVTEAYLKNFKAQYGYASDSVAASSYDATRAMLEAIAHAGSTEPAAIRNAFASLTDFAGATGLITHWSAGGNALLPVSVQVVKNGAFQQYAEVTDPAIITPAH